MSSELESGAGGSRVWRRYDDGYIVRSMTVEDAAVVKNWYNTTMGDTPRHDLTVALSCYPINSPGFYIGEYEGEVVASAVRLPWGENIMYGSLYYVEPKYRRRGFGTRLRDEVAREHVGTRTLCVDAVQGKVSEDNRSKFSYRPGYECYRYTGPALDNYSDIVINNNNAPNIVQASQVDFEKFISFDNDCFVSRDFPPRREFLRQFTSLPDVKTYVAINSSGQLVGYGCRRPCMNERQEIIGPLYATSAEIAEALLAKLCTDVPGHNVNIAVSSRNPAALDLVKRFGLKELFAINRMYLNDLPNEHRDTTFALTSIDVCGF